MQLRLPTLRVSIFFTCINFGFAFPPAGAPLNKRLRQLGFGFSPPHVENLLRTGRVFVNGVEELDGSRRVAVDAFFRGVEDENEVNKEKHASSELGMLVDIIAPTLVLYNKPCGLLTALSDKKGIPHINIPKEFSKKGMSPVGRLDQHSTGLLLMTDEGHLHKNILDPRLRIAREYVCVVCGDVDPHGLRQKLAAGVQTQWGTFNGTLLEAKPFKGSYEHQGCCADGRTLPTRNDGPPLDQETYEAQLAATGHFLPEHTSSMLSEVRLQVFEGKKREVRRMLAHCGHVVLNLRREAIGPIRLGALKMGESRKATPEEFRWAMELMGEEYVAKFDTGAANLVLQVEGSHSLRIIQYLERQADEVASNDPSWQVQVLADFAVPGKSKAPKRLLLLKAVDPTATIQHLMQDPNLAYLICQAYVVGAGVAPSLEAAAGLLARHIQDMRPGAANSQIALRVSAFPSSSETSLLALLEPQLPATASLAPAAFTHLASAVQTTWGILYGIASRSAFFGRPQKEDAHTLEEQQMLPSRAFFKLAETFRRFPDLQLSEDAVALDAGAAPGGWTHFLSSAVSRVVAVDPAELSLPPASNVEHMQMMLEDALPLLKARSERVDVYVSDMYLFEFNQVVKLFKLVQESGVLKPGAIVILTLKCTGERSRYDRRVKALMSSLEPLCEPGSTRLLHLFTNKLFERTVVARALGTIPDSES